MKKIAIIFTLITFSYGLACAQQNNVSYDDIVFNIKSGNVKELGKYFNSRIELKINNEGNIYSKAQAEMILRDFFEKDPPQNFVIRHKGSSAKGLPYIIGDLTTDKMNYRAYILFKQINDRYFIQEIQFDKE